MVANLNNDEYIVVKTSSCVKGTNTSCYSYSRVLVITIYSDIMRTPCTSCSSIRDMVLIHSILSASSQYALVVGSSMSSIIMGSSK